MPKCAILINSEQSRAEQSRAEQSRAALCQNFGRRKTFIVAGRFIVPVYQQSIPSIYQYTESLIAPSCAEVC